MSLARSSIEASRPAPPPARSFPFPRLSGAGWTVVVLVAAVLLLSLLPMLRLVFAALGQGIEPFWEEITRRGSLRAAYNTLDTALWSGLLALMLGTGFAFAHALTDIRSKKLLAISFLLPMMIAPQVTALAWLQLFGPSSAILNSIGMAPPPGTENVLYGRGGIILLLGLQHAPLVFLTVRAGLLTIPREVVSASMGLGAGPARTVFQVILPMARPFILAGGILAFVSAVGNFGIPALLGIPEGYFTLPTLIYQRLSSFGPSIIRDAASLSVLVAVIAAAGTLLAGWILRRRGTAIAPDRAVTFRLGAARPFVEAGLWLTNVGLLVVPLLALLTASLLPSYGMALNASTITFDNYVEVLFRQDVTARAFVNSFLLSGSAALILMGLCFLASYGLVRRAGRFRQLVDMLIEVPYALPGVVLAIAAILLFLRPIPLLGISIYGTAWIILAAYLCRFFPLALKPVAAAIESLPRQTEYAAAALGASFAVRLRRVVLPAVLPSAVAGGLLVFLTAFNELTVSALLWSSGTETLGVALFNLEEAGHTTLASALAVLTVMVVLLLIAILDRLTRRVPPGTLPWR